MWAATLLAGCAMSHSALPTVGPTNDVAAYRPPQIGPWPPTVVEASRGGNAYRQGDYAEAFREWAVLARMDEDAAQYNLGVLYARGLGVDRDLVAAWKAFRQAAVRGYAPAQEALGNMYGYGIGVPVNYPLAYALKTSALGPSGISASVIGVTSPGCATATDKSMPLRLLHAAMTPWYFCQAWSAAAKIQEDPLILYDMHQLAQDLGERPLLSGEGPVRRPRR